MFNLLIDIILTMKKKILIILAFILTFALGFAFKSMTTNNSSQSIRKVTGIGGIFFKCRDPKKIREWYKTNLGLNTNQYGVVFEWRQGADTTKKGFTQWSPFKESTHYFDPSEKDFMINYRVADLEGLVKELGLPEDIPKIVIVNKGLVDFDYVLKDGDKVSIFPPLAGG